MLDSAGLAPSEICRDILPPNRFVRATYLGYAADSAAPSPALVPALNCWLDLVPNSVPNWPGLDLDWRPAFLHGTSGFPLKPFERDHLMRAIERLLTNRDPEGLLTAWSAIAKKLPNVLPGCTQGNPLMSDSTRSFGATPLDWRRPLDDSFHLDLDPATNTLHVTATPALPAAVDLTGRAFLLTPNMNYIVQFEPDSEPSPPAGFWWELRDLQDASKSIIKMEISAAQAAANKRTQLPIPASPNPRLVFLALTYRQRPGIAPPNTSFSIRDISVTATSQVTP